MLASQIISLPVISIYSGKLIGIVENILFDTKYKKCNYLVIFNEIEDLTYVLNSKNIYKLGKDCLFIKNNSEVDLFESKELELSSFSNPISTSIYSLNCEFIGKITDINLDDNFKIEKYIVNDKTYSTSQILNFSNTTSILSDDKVKLCNFKEKAKISNNLVQSTTTDSKRKIEIQSPIRAVTNYSFLLNRTTTKDIQKQNGEIIVKSGTVITSNILNKVRANGKLLELTHYCR